MKTIRNKSTRPIKVPLPRGQALHLSPRKTGEIANKAVDHPPLVKLVEAGDLEILGDGSHGDDPRKAASGVMRTTTHGHHPSMNSTQGRGDR